MSPTTARAIRAIWAIATPAIEQSRHIGTTRITASGSDQFSYWAANTKNTSTTARAKTVIGFFSKSWIEPVLPD